MMLTVHIFVLFEIELIHNCSRRMEESEGALSVAEWVGVCENAKRKNRSKVLGLALWCSV